MDATGIHNHPTLKLGRRPPKRHATLDVAEFLTLPARPIAEAAPPTSWPMDFNDVAGDCVVAGLDHALQAIAVQLGVGRTNWTSQELLALYQSQNPSFRSWSDGGSSRDNGMEIQSFLEHLVVRGEILAFGSVALTEEAMKSAIWVGLALVTGEMLDAAQQSQSIWDYRSGSPAWGGHCTCSVGFDPGNQGLVTWGKLVEATDSFVTHQVEEAWFILTTEMVNHAGFRNHFDLPGFAAAVAELTDGKVIVPVDPPAPDGPSVDPLDDFPFEAVDNWAARPHVFRSATAASKQYRAWRGRHA